MDLWWLINCKKRNFSSVNGSQIVWIEPNLNDEANFAKKILAETGVNPDTRVKDLTEAEESKPREIIRSRMTLSEITIRGCVNRIFRRQSYSDDK